MTPELIEKLLANPPEPALQELVTHIYIKYGSEKFAHAIAYYRAQEELAKLAS